LHGSFASDSFSAGMPLNTSKQDHVKKLTVRQQTVVLFSVLNDEYVAGHTGLVDHILFSAGALGLPLLCFRSVQFLKLIFYKVV